MLLFQRFPSQENLDWPKSFDSDGPTEAEMKAMISAREVEAIDNLTYRVIIVAGAQWHRVEPDTLASSYFHFKAPRHRRHGVFFLSDPIHQHWRSPMSLLEKLDKYIRACFLGHLDRVARASSCDHSDR